MENAYNLKDGIIKGSTQFIAETKNGNTIVTLSGLQSSPESFNIENVLLNNNNLFTKMPNAKSNDVINNKSIIQHKKTGEYLIIIGDNEKYYICKVIMYINSKIEVGDKETLILKTNVFANYTRSSHSFVGNLKNDIIFNNQSVSDDNLQETTTTINNTYSNNQPYDDADGSENNELISIDKNFDIKQNKTYELDNKQDKNISEPENSRNNTIFNRLEKMPNNNSNQLNKSAQGGKRKSRRRERITKGKNRKGGKSLRFRKKQNIINPRYSQY